MGKSKKRVVRVKHIKKAKKHKHIKLKKGKHLKTSRVKIHKIKKSKKHRKVAAPGHLHKHVKHTRHVKYAKAARHIKSSGQPKPAKRAKASDSFYSGAVDKVIGQKEKEHKSKSAGFFSSIFGAGKVPRQSKKERIRHAKHAAAKHKAGAKHKAAAKHIHIKHIKHLKHIARPPAPKKDNKKNKKSKKAELAKLRAEKKAKIRAEREARRQAKIKAREEKRKQKLAQKTAKKEARLRIITEKKFAKKKTESSRLSRAIEIIRPKQVTADLKSKERISADNLKKVKEELDRIRKEISKVIVGQEVAVDGMIRALLCNGHLLVEAVPGTAKTLLIRALAVALGCKFSRIQFTVDLLPSDITGIVSYEKSKGFYTIKGPVFANLVIADEINRAPPKTQSALLEAMQEHQATIGKQTFRIEEPFFVMATQNPIESSGTYQLPEAQIDRFLFKLTMSYPKPTDEQRILYQNISLNKFDDFKLKAVITPKRIIEMQKLTKKIYVSDEVEKYILRIVDSTRNPRNYGLKHGHYIEYGGSPRASICLFIAAKAQAIMEGDGYVRPQHIKKIAHDVLRHRILLNYEGEAENIKTDEIIDDILAKVKVP